MESMLNLRIHIAPVGFEVDRIVIPASKMKADMVYLVADDNIARDKAHPYLAILQKQLKKKKIDSQVAYADRFKLFQIIKTVKEIIQKEKKNDIYINVASGSKIHAIGCMMASMIFDDRTNIRPFYTVAEKYPEYDGKNQQTYGVKDIYSLPTYPIETPKKELLEALRIIKDEGGKIQKKQMAKIAEEKKLINIGAREENHSQARFASLDKNIVQPLADVWGYVEIEKIGRNRWIKLTEDGSFATEFLI